MINYIHNWFVWPTNTSYQYFSKTSLSIAIVSEFIIKHGVLMPKETIWDDNPFHSRQRTVEAAASLHTSPQRRVAVIALPRRSANSSRSLRSPLNPFWRQDCTTNRVPPRNPLLTALSYLRPLLARNTLTKVSLYTGKTVFRNSREKEREVSIDFFT